LELPRELGEHPETGKKIIVNIGRFGPYIGHDGKFKSIPKGDSVFTIGLDRAVALLAEARASNAVLRELGVHPDDQKPVDVCSGRYGPYVRHGKVNATLPKDTTPEGISLEEGLALLAARVAKGPVVKKGAARKKPVAGEKTATGKPAAKKPTAKKASATKKKTPAKKAAATSSRS
jgi:DNA topoisomerase-1